MSATTGARPAPTATGPDAWIEWIAAHPVRCAAAVLLLAMPLLANDFFLVQVFGWSCVLGMIALGLMFLGGYGGMVSLLQMTVAGLAGYLTAIFGTSGIDSISLRWPWVAAVLVAIVVAVLFGTLCGALAVRTAGIYTIMITLAIAAAFFYFTNQNYAIFNGFTGFNLIRAPVFWGVNWRDPVPFYYVCLFFAALSYFIVVYVSRTPFGLALQGTRDNARRMAALGHDVVAIRVAAYALASVIAAVAGVLLVWLNREIAPSTAGVGPAIDILVIAVVGGLGNPIGPFIGALIYVLLRTFSVDILVAVGIGGERFRMLIGLGFLLVVFFSPDGVLGLWARWQNRRRPAQAPL